MKNQKYTFISLTILLIGFVIVSFYSRNFLPPGTSKLIINDSTLYVDNAEISNFNWLEYTYDLKKKFGANSKEYLNALPDSTLKLDEFPAISPDFRSSFSRSYPVIGVSYEQAVDFCKWRSEKVNELFKTNVTYRLMTKKEWETIQATLKNDKFNKGYNEIEKGKMLNFNDNVSEMIAEKGIAKGMNWKILDTLTTTPNPRTDVSYDKPNNWLGFRCVATMK